MEWFLILKSENNGNLFAVLITPKNIQSKILQIFGVKETAGHNRGIKRENYELNVKYNKLEKNQTILKKKVSDIENELYSSNVIIHGISEHEDEEGPERYRLITEVIARTIYASSYKEQIQIARKIPY